MEHTNNYKKQAAEAAVEYVKSGMVIGLGSGSTSEYALKRISEYLQSGKLSNVIGIPSSIQTAHLAQELEIPISTLDDHPVLDLTIDGADQVDPDLNLIKGGGGALLREKILAQLSQQFIVIIDESKLTDKLGETFPLPVEVLPFAWKPSHNFLKSLGAEVTLRTNLDGSIYKTDQENLILDCEFDAIESPREVASQLDARAGILEHGLFIAMAQEVIVADAKGIRHLKSQN